MLPLCVLSKPEFRGSGMSEMSLQNAADLTRGDARVGRRAVIAASAGNALEWYDFTVYALFAVYIAKNFFPGADQTTELIKAFLAFGLGFVIRPLGAIVLGSYADHAGRKAALTLTIFLMAVGTLVIAAAPTYAAIGIGAPILLLVGRVLQGFSAGGEVGGAAAFLVEHAPADKKGRYASWLQASMAMSNIIGALVAFAVTSLLTQDQIGDWGWRIPFIIGLAIAPIGMWMRRTLDETPHFKLEIERHYKTSRAQRAPLTAVFSEFPRELIKGVGMCVLWTVSTYTLVIFMPIYVQRTFGITGSQAFMAALIGNVFMVVTCVFAGALSDKIGRKKILVGAAIILALGTHPLLWLVKASPTLEVMIFVQVTFCIITALFVGVAPAALSEIFPTRVRSTGMSLCYNTATTIFGGFAPAILTWLSQQGGIYAPAWYVTVAAICALVSLATFKTSTE